MKVLHLYAGNLYGGIERMLATIAEHREIEPRLTHEFALCFRGRLWSELEAAGVEPHDLGRVRLRNPLSVYWARRRLKQLVRASHCDIVITHSCWPHLVFGPAVRRCGVPLVNWVHDALNGTHRIERRAGKTQPDFVIANSHYTAQSVSTVFPNVPRQVIYYPIAQPAKELVESREAIRASLGTSNQSVVVLQVSRMETWKGHKVLLSALAKLPSETDWILWLVGGSQRPSEVAYENELRTLSAEWGIGQRVRFLGQRADVSRLMSAADLFCQPNSGPEPFGIVFVEALYAGLPVVSSAFGGAAEIVDNRCGRLTPAGDATQLAQVLGHLIADGSLRQELAKAGPTRARALCDPAGQLGRLAETLERIAKPDAA